MHFVPLIKKKRKYNLKKDDHKKVVQFFIIAYILKIHLKN